MRSTRSATARSSAWTSSADAPKPSKPPGSCRTAMFQRILNAERRRSWQSQHNGIRIWVPVLVGLEVDGVDLGARRSSAGRRRRPSTRYRARVDVAHPRGDGSLLARSDLDGARRNDDRWRPTPAGRVEYGRILDPVDAITGRSRRRSCRPTTPSSAVRGTDGSLHIAYELVLTNATDFAVEVEQVEVLDAKTDRVLLSLAGDALSSRMNPVGVPGADANPHDPARPSGSAVVWLDVVVRRKADLPNALEHRLLSSTRPAAGEEPIQFTSLVARVPLRRRTAVEARAARTQRHLGGGRGMLRQRHTSSSGPARRRRQRGRPAALRDRLDEARSSSIGPGSETPTDCRATSATASP